MPIRSTIVYGWFQWETNSDWKMRKLKFLWANRVYAWLDWKHKLNPQLVRPLYNIFRFSLRWAINLGSTEIPILIAIGRQSLEEVVEQQWDGEVWFHYPLLLGFDSWAIVESMGRPLLVIFSFCKARSIFNGTGLWLI